ncbi:Zinc/iron permease [Hysterangium stoloniferum]|nr:Zinc/iron permease [Hysterangium stoloniferum]
MDGLFRIILLSVALGVSSFAVGILPLSFTFSAKNRLQLSTFGNGLLLGTALGVIIPEGIEAVSSPNGTPSGSRIALSLIFGFTFMLIMEQFFAPHSPSLPPPRSEPVFQLPPLGDEVTDNDPDAIDMENLSTLRHENRAHAGHLTQSIIAHPLTLGLVIHSLADGLALGASASGEHGDTSLSFLVFLALIIHKSPTALALTSSLLSTSLPRAEIRMHVAVFSFATPFGALASFFLLGYLGSRTGNWTGVAMLVSGGTFLYVATVIQPIGAHSHDDSDAVPSEKLDKVQRLSLLVSGIFLPFVIGSLFGHEHGAGHADH